MNYRLFASLKVGLAVAGGLLLVIGLVSHLSAAEPVISAQGVSTDAWPGHDATLRLELLNHTDQVLPNGFISATLPAGLAYVPGSTQVFGEGWPMVSSEPISSGQTLIWGPYGLPVAGVTAHNPFGIHTLMDSCSTPPGLHLDGAKTLVGSGGYVTQLFYPITTTTTGPSDCAINFVQEAYSRNLIPILRLQGARQNGIWQAPDPGPNGDYAETARAYANFVAGLPRRNTNPLYIAVWNEPDLWIEWSNAPNATQYARFFVAVSNAIRNLGDARIRLVNGALTPGNPAFLEAMLRVPGFRDAFDVWASHCYPYNHPAWYNSHTGFVRYRTYAIDCYLDEMSIIKRYGRTNFKVMLTETGYPLGDKTFGFEGFPAINDSNRAGYITSAFKDYWQHWPEVVAVTPFELSDPANFWVSFDWIKSTHPFTPYLQYTSVSALPKPVGQIEPYGFQVMFKARAANDATPGDYFVQLAGSEAGGSSAAAKLVTVTVRAAAPGHTYYLPVIFKRPPLTGPWYMAAQTAPPDGAIVPTRILTAAGPLEVQAAPTVRRLSLGGEPLALAVVDDATGAVLLSDDRLLRVDLAALAIRDTILVGPQPQALARGDAAQLFIGLDGAVAQVDLAGGQILATTPLPGRITALAWDPAGRRLFAADAQNDQLLVLAGSPPHVTHSLPLPEQPGPLVFDAAANRLVIAFPGAKRVSAFNAVDLTETNRAQITGGPILDLALDTGHQRLIVLNALAPGWRGLTLLDSELRQVALAAGPELRSAPALALTSAGHLLLPEAGGLVQIDGDSLAVGPRLPLPALTPAGGIAAAGRAVYLLDGESQSLLEVSQ